MIEQHEEKNVSEDLPKYPINPLEVVTRKFKPREILYEDRGFVIAVGEWTEPTTDGSPPIPQWNAVAVRWHIPGEIGYPNGFGRPQWMFTPLDASAIESLDNPMLPNAIRITLLGNPFEVRVGGWIHNGLDWHLVTYIYGDGTTMVQACGLGKSGAYPMEIETVKKSAFGRSTMDIWYRDVMGGEPCVWLDPRGVVKVTIASTPNMLWGQQNLENAYQALELIPSPIKDVWHSGGDEVAVFDYMLDEHALLGQLNWEDLRADDDPSELSMVALRDQVGRFMSSVDVQEIYTAIQSRRLGRYSRVFTDDLTEEQKNDRFEHDVSLGGIYYDLRQTDLVK